MGAMLRVLKMECTISICPLTCALETRLHGISVLAAVPGRVVLKRPINQARRYIPLRRGAYLAFTASVCAIGFFTDGRDFGVGRWLAVEDIINCIGFSSGFPINLIAHNRPGRKRNL